MHYPKESVYRLEFINFLLPVLVLVVSKICGSLQFNWKYLSYNRQYWPASWNLVLTEGFLIGHGDSGIIDD
jgi:hypothetical protein